MYRLTESPSKPHSIIIFECGHHFLTIRLILVHRDKDRPCRHSICSVQTSNEKYTCIYLLQIRLGKAALIPNGDPNGNSVYLLLMFFFFFEIFVSH